MLRGVQIIELERLAFAGQIGEIPIFVCLFQHSVNERLPAIHNQLPIKITCRITSIVHTEL
jgi:hypothetical protein